ncbi:MAG: mechanosensitive ion channel family protein [Acidobacteria bacterium]|nr:mechanosensitive ion channel family protein [Acidobacteriota bacterium]
MESVQRFITIARDVLNTPLVKTGSTQLTLWSILYLIVLFFILLFVAKKVRFWLANRILVRSNLDPGVRESVGSIARYLIIVIGFFVILQTAGIDLTALSILAGAVGIGVGFGLQNIANNFISGLIILFERPIKAGDRIEVGKVEGEVISIGARATTVVTNDNISVIVPNSSFISQDVVNWSYTDRKVRFKIGLSVAYGSDPRLVERLLLEVAGENPDVLGEPEPGVRFLEFGDNGLHFELRAWSTSLLHKKGKLISDLNFGIHEKFAAHGIEFPFPQRDIHVRTLPPDWRG